MTAVCRNQTLFPTKWLVYHDKMRTSSIFLYDATMVLPLALLFFGGKVRCSAE